MQADIGDLGSIPELGRFTEEGNGNPLQYSCLGNPMDKEPGGLQSMGAQESDMTKLPNDLNSRYSDIFPKRRCISVCSRSTFILLITILIFMNLNNILPYLSLFL